MHRITPVLAWPIEEIHHKLIRLAISALKWNVGGLYLSFHLLFAWLCTGARHKAQRNGWFIDKYWKMLNILTRFDNTVDIGTLLYHFKYGYTNFRSSLFEVVWFKKSFFGQVRHITWFSTVLYGCIWDDKHPCTGSLNQIVHISPQY